MYRNEYNISEGKVECKKSNQRLIFTRWTIKRVSSLSIYLYKARKLRNSSGASQRFSHTIFVSLPPLVPVHELHTCQNSPRQCTHTHTICAPTGRGIYSLSETLSSHPLQDWTRQEISRTRAHAYSLTSVSERARRSPCRSTADAPLSLSCVW